MGIHNLILNQSDIKELRERHYPYKIIYGRNATQLIAEVTIPSEIEEMLNIKEMKGNFDVSRLWA